MSKTSLNVSAKRNFTVGWTFLSDLSHKEMARQECPAYGIFAL